VRRIVESSDSARYAVTAMLNSSPGRLLGPVLRRGRSLRLLAAGVLLPQLSGSSAAGSQAPAAGGVVPANGRAADAASRNMVLPGMQAGRSARTEGVSFEAAAPANAGNSRGSRIVSSRMACPAAGGSSGSQPQRLRRPICRTGLRGRGKSDRRRRR
jgi:hypothetical protein